jgi:hypothetical protein
MRIRKRFYAVTLLAAAGIAAPAQAQVTGSNITSPPDPHFVLYEIGAAHPATIDVAGTTVGSGNVDVQCVTGSRYVVVASDVPVAPNGTFAVSDAPLAALADAHEPQQPGRTCRLLALPAGTTPPDLAPFSGPRLGVSKLSWERISGAGANDGLLYDYNVYAAGLGFAVEARSFGDCATRTGFIQEPNWFETAGYSLYCNGYPAERIYQDPFYGLEIDGEPAYAPGWLGDGRLGGAGPRSPGFPELKVDPVRFSAANGDLTVAETNPLAKCAPDNRYPPTGDGCTSLTRVPVQLKRTTEITHDTQVIRVVDRWSSTDGRPHRLDLSLGQAVCLANAFSGCSDEIQYRFPGETAYALHDDDDATAATGSVAGPFAPLKPILARGADAARGGAAIIPAQRSEGASFTNSNQFGLEYKARTIPANGELMLVHTYVTTRSGDEIEAFAADVAATMQPVPETPVPSAPGGSRSGDQGAPHTAAAPRLVRNGRARVRRAGRTFIVTTGDRVRCAAGCVVSVRTSAGGRSVGSSRLQIAAGRSAAVRVRLNARGARQLRRHGRLRLTVAVSARSGSGAPVTRRRSVTVRTGTS